MDESAVRALEQRLTVLLPRATAGRVEGLQTWGSFFEEENGGYEDFVPPVSESPRGKRPREPAQDAARAERAPSQEKPDAVLDEAPLGSVDGAAAESAGSAGSSGTSEEDSEDSETDSDGCDGFTAEQRKEKFREHVRLRQIVLDADAAAKSAAEETTPPFNSMDG